MINFVHLCGFLIRQNSSFYTLQCPSGFFPCQFSGVDPPALSSAVEILGHLENIETARCRSSSVLMILISYNEKPGNLPRLPVVIVWLYRLPDLFRLLPLH